MDEKDVYNDIITHIGIIENHLDNIQTLFDKVKENLSKHELNESNFLISKNKIFNVKNEYIDTSDLVYLELDNGYKMELNDKNILIRVPPKNKLNIHDAVNKAMNKALNDIKSRNFNVTSSEYKKPIDADDMYRRYRNTITPLNNEDDSDNETVVFTKNFVEIEIKKAWHNGFQIGAISRG